MQTYSGDTYQTIRSQFARNYCAQPSALTRTGDETLHDHAAQAIAAGLRTDALREKLAETEAEYHGETQRAYRLLYALRIRAIRSLLRNA